MSISPAEFTYVSEFVRSEAAIVLGTGKEYLVEARLDPLVKELGFGSLSELVHALQTKRTPVLKSRVVESLTTNETLFFRDVEPFEILHQEVLPKVLAKREDRKELSIWCAASSTGQEPYSIAMLLRERFPQLEGWRVNIVATDISEEVLAKARKGVYTQLEVNRGLPVSYLVKYFQKSGLEWQIKEPIRQMVSFRQLNLVKPISGVPMADIVFIRNVLIYFDLDTKRAVLESIRRLLRPDGYLFLGGAETTLNVNDNYSRVPLGKGSCYQTKGGV
jgi:chemotaxis protein methyltransferase CheR